MPAAFSAAAHSSNTAAARPLRVLIVGSPPPRTNRSPRSTPPSTRRVGFERRGEAVSQPSASAAPASVTIFMFDAGIISLPALSSIEQLAGVERSHDDAPCACDHDGRRRRPRRGRAAARATACPAGCGCWRPRPVRLRNGRERRRRRAATACDAHAAEQCQRRSARAIGAKAISAPAAL